jgi:hypothetical protein
MGVDNLTVTSLRTSKQIIGKPKDHLKVTYNLKNKYNNTHRAKIPPTDLLPLVHEFLVVHGFTSTARIFSVEVDVKQELRGTGVVDGMRLPEAQIDLLGIYEQWCSAAGGKPVTRGNTTIEGENTKANGVVREEEEEESSDMSATSSAESSDSEDEDKRPNTAGTKRKAQSDSSDSESDSSSESDAEEEPARKKQKGTLVAKSADPVSNGVWAKSNGITKKPEISTQTATSSEEDSSSVESEEEKTTKSTQRNGWTGLDKKDASSSDSESEGESDSNAEEAMVIGNPSKASELTPLTAKIPSSSGSSTSDDSSSDDEASAPAKHTPKPTVAPAKRKRSASPKPAESTPSTKVAKKMNVPFSRIPADIKVDPKLASNAYVPYDYAERAHQDLIVTKGKGFTKEKNKKKRGS